MLITTRRERPADTEAPSHYLSLMASLLSPVAAGLYTFSPLGQKILNKIEGIVHKHMRESGALEISMPILQPSSLWKKSGRWEIYGEEMLKVTNRDGQQFCLAPTQEEVIVSFVKEHLQSYKQLPITLYQIGKKFRDEKRPRHGVLRTREFTMKDAYSFDLDEQGVENSYTSMRNAYIKIFQEMGLRFIPVPASTDEMGGEGSEEFLAFSEYGEDRFLSCDNCGYSVKSDDFKSEDNKCVQCNHEMSQNTGIEIGHIFKLGRRYTEPLNLTYLDRDGNNKYVEMGCYGIGISRALAPIIEQNHDDRGIIWPVSVSPFEFVIIPVNYLDTSQKEVANNIYQYLKLDSRDVILDDRELSAGIKFRDADLLGFPYKLVIGPRSLQESKVELESRRTKSKVLTSLEGLAQNLDRALNSLR